MKMLIAALAILFPLAALAGGTYRDPEADLVLELKDDQCTDKKVLAFINPALHKQFRAASVTQGGTNYAACWGEPPFAPELYFIVDERGERGAIEKAAITPTTGI